MRASLHVLTITLALAQAGMAWAQEATLAFQGLKAGAGEPVEITADQLNVTQSASTAEFTGNVLVIQGGLRLSSDRLTVEYVEGDKTTIDRLIAEGNVLLSTPAEAAESARAVYVLTSQQLEMTGEVVELDSVRGRDGKNYKPKRQPRPAAERTKPKPSPEHSGDIDMLAVARPDLSPGGVFGPGVLIGYGDPEFGACVLADEVRWFSRGSYDEISVGEARTLAACLLAAADSAESF
jgi:lipopolysaccharide export system protein LptA